MNGSGKGGNSRRRPWKHRDGDKRQDGSRNASRETGQEPKGGGQNVSQSAKGAKRNAEAHRSREASNQRGGAAGRSSTGWKADPFFDRPRWTPPQINAEPIPTPDCPLCGKPIKDMAAAITDKLSGAPIHFDCAIARIADGENLETGDTITYIGGGRFAVIHFPNPQDTRSFKIKKIFELENKDSRADWRINISDHYSVV
jgi:hypothetical protein